MTQKQRDRLLAMARMMLEPEATSMNDYSDWDELAAAVKAAKKGKK